MVVPYLGSEARSGMDPERLPDPVHGPGRRPLALSPASASSPDLRCRGRRPSREPVSEGAAPRVRPCTPPAPRAGAGHARDRLILGCPIGIGPSPLQAAGLAACAVAASLVLSSVSNEGTAAFNPVTDGRSSRPCHDGDEARGRVTASLNPGWQKPRASRELRWKTSTAVSSGSRSDARGTRT